MEASVMRPAQESTHRLGGPADELLPEAQLL